MTFSIETIAVLNGDPPGPKPPKEHFFSSSESEGEEDHRKKFKIKIKPLPAESANCLAPSVDELRASIGNIALSPSPLVSTSPRLHCSEPALRLPTVPPVPEDPTPPPTPLPPKGYTPPPTPPPTIVPPLESPPSVAPVLPVPSPPSVAPVLPVPSPPSVAPVLPVPSPPSVAPVLPVPSPPSGAPVLPVPSPPSGAPVLPVPSPPSVAPLLPVPSPPSGAPVLPVHSPPSVAPLLPVHSPHSVAPVLPVHSPPSVAPVLPVHSPPSVAPVPPVVPSPPKARTPVSPTSSPGPAVVDEPSRTIPPPLVFVEKEQKSPEGAAPPVPPAPSNEGLVETAASPKDVGQVSRAAPPPPPPPTYRAVVSLPGPTTGGMGSGEYPQNDQPSLVWFDRGKFYLTFEGCSRGPSPLTMGAQDTLPVAAAFTETVNAFFKGANPNKCVVKITGEMVLSFPAGITRHFANNPSPAVLTFSITHYSWLEHVLPNPQLLCCDTATTPNPDCKTFWVNMPNLITHLKKVAEQKPQATYYNVDMLKYQVSARGLTSTPLNLAASWRCEPTSTDLRIDYKYNGGSMTTPVALNNVQFLIPVDGGVTKLLAVLPPAAWNAEQQRILWKIPDISQKSENGGIGSLLARFQLSEGPSKPSPLAVQFTSEGSTLSGCDIELAGPGYRFSLIKKRFAAGKYLADN
uniref:SH3GL interacting endocytic adaptor 1 n=1 Tax=Oncorhynchus mykiss TaxID=8022 RepID=A0A8K9Y6A5_ONCMY